jgi:anti-sigma factor RsiW
MKHVGDPKSAPSAEDLAAYLEGELITARWLQVEAWLAEHPEVAAELESQRELAVYWSHVFQSHRPPEPSAEQWDKTLAQVESGLARPAASRAVERYLARPMPRSGGRWTRWFAAAAAVMAMMLAGERLSRPVISADEVFPVATPEEVDILSVHGQDMAYLVVGDTPLKEPLALATGEDILVESIQPDADGMVPHVGMTPEDTASPMLVAPVSAAPPEKAP